MGADTCETMPLSVTFIQIGDDPKAEAYLQQLDGAIQAECAANGETFDLVDTIKHDDIDAAMKEIKGTKSSGKNGALIGAFAGAALGVGGMYIYNKQQARKRTKGWGGKWAVTYDGEDICTLNITDDEVGNLGIEGFPSGDATTGAYSVPSPEENEDKKFFNKASKGDQCDYIILMDRSAQMNIVDSS